MHFERRSAVREHADIIPSILWYCLPRCQTSLCSISSAEPTMSTFSARQESLKTDVKHSHYMLFLSFPFRLLMSHLNQTFCVLWLSRLHGVDSKGIFPQLHCNTGVYQSRSHVFFFLRLINYANLIMSYWCWAICNSSISYLLDPNISKWHIPCAYWKKICRKGACRHNPLPPPRL